MSEKLAGFGVRARRRIAIAWPLVSPQSAGLKSTTIPSAAGAAVWRAIDK